MTPDQRATAPAGLQRNAILSARAIGFPEFGVGPGHVPSFSRSDLPPGGAWCLRCERVIYLRQFIEGKECKGKETT